MSDLVLTQNGPGKLNSCVWFVIVLKAWVYEASCMDFR